MTKYPQPKVLTTLWSLYLPAPSLMSRTSIISRVVTSITSITVTAPLSLPSSLGSCRCCRPGCRAATGLLESWGTGPAAPALLGPGGPVQENSPRRDGRQTNSLSVFNKHPCQGQWHSPTLAQDTLQWRCVASADCVLRFMDKQM